MRCWFVRAGRSGSGSERVRRRDLQEAARMIDLQGGVIQAEALVQGRLHCPAGGVAVAVGRDQHMRGERWEATRDFPDVKVVDLDDPGLLHERLADRVRVEPLRCGLEEDAPGSLYEREP